MAEFYYRVKGDFDTKSIEDGTYSIEELAVQLDNAGTSIDDINGKTIKIKTDVETKGFVKVTKAVQVTDELSASQRKLANDIAKKNNAEQGSVVSARAVVAAFTQQLNTTRRGSEAYKNLEFQVKKSNIAYQEAQGIQRGSITSIQGIIDKLQAQQRNLRLTSDQYDKLSNRIQVLKTRQQALQGIQKGSTTDLRSQKSALEQAIDATNRYTDAGKYRRLQNELRKVTRELDKGKSGARVFNETMQKVANVRLALTTIVEVFRGINSAIQVFVSRQKQVESFELALKNVGLSSGEVSGAFEQAYQTATNLGAPLQAVEKSYRRMVPALKAIGTNSADADKFIRNLSARTATLGLNTEQSNRFIEAFAQVLSKGRLAGEELNQQISELDGAFRTQLADALAVPVSKLSELVESGQITATVFRDAFNRMANGADELEERLANGTATIQQLQNNIRSIETKNIEKIGNAFNVAIREITRIQQVFAKFIEDLTETEGFDEIAKAVNELVIGFRKFAQAVAAVGGVIAKVIGFFLELVGAFVNLDTVGTGITQTVGFLIAAFASTAAIVGFIKLIVATGAALVALTAKLWAATAAQLAFNAASGKAAAGGVGKAAQATQLAIPGLQAYGATATTAAAATKKGTGILARFGAGFKKATGFIAKNRVALTPWFALISGGVVLLAQAKKKNDEVAEAIKGMTDVVPAAETAIKDYGKALEEAKIKAKGADKSIEELNKEAENEPFEAFGLSLDGTNRIFVAFRDEAAKVEKQTSKLRKEIDEYSNGLSSLRDVSGATNKDLVAAKEGYSRLLPVLRRSAAATRDRLNELEKEGKANTSQAQALRVYLQAQNAEIKTTEKLSEAIQEEIRQRIIQGQKIGTVTERLAILKSVQEGVQQGAVLANLKAQAQTYEQLNRGIISATQAEAQRLGASLGGIEAEIEAERNLIRAFNDKKNAGEELSAKEQKDFEASVKRLGELGVKAGEAGLAIRKGMVDAFKQAIADAQRLGDISLDIGSKFDSAAQGIRSVGSSAIQSIQGLIDQTANTFLTKIDEETQKRIEGINQSSATKEEKERAIADLERQTDERRNRVIKAQNEAKKFGAEVEYQVAVASINAAARRQQLELRIAQIKLQTAAAVAKQEGDNQTAVQLYRLAGAYDQLIPLVRDEAKLSAVAARYKRDTAIAAADVATNNRQANDALVLSKIDAYRRNMGEVATNANNLANRAQDASNKFGAIANTNFAGAVEKGAIAANDFRTNADKSKTAAQNMATQFGKAATNMKNLNGFANQLYGTIQKILAAGSRRAMGGPVLAGQQYTVNDGGGREGFINSSGRFSMLPAGRNIKWTAPTSGMVIPASLVDDFRQQQIIKTNNISRSLGTKVSGNLIGRADNSRSINSSTTSQRIVNNVTIQSQQPVTDASRLMTELSRARRRTKY